MGAELQSLIDRQREESFRPEYRDQVPDAKACGILVAHHFEWDGTALLELAAAALEDANFHDGAARVRAMLAEVA
jgi:hypothetical protein